VTAQLSSQYVAGMKNLTPDEPEPTKDSLDSISLAVPTKFSFTQLAAFETCPRQYQYAHIFKIQPPGRHTFSYGQSLHKALELFYQQLMEGKDPSEEALLRLLDEHWVSDWYESRQQEEMQKKKGQETLTSFFQVNKEFFRPPLFVEKDFNLKIGEATFRGKIDRIDEVEGGVEIVDYKTGRLKKQKDVDADEQLSLYALAATQVLGLVPKKLSLYFLDEGKKVSTTRTEEQLAAFAEQVAETVNAIRSSKFSPTPGFHCQFCDFLNICEVGLKKVGKR
jgi:RecB family exonuclease